MKQIKIKLTGVSPLLLCSDKLADPLNPLTIQHKELTSKRKKTVDDHLLIARSQWQGLLYWDSENGVIVPTQNIRAALIGGGKLNKLGMALKRGTLMMTDFVPLDYGKKLSIAQLWDQDFKDVRSVVVSQSRVMAYRPKFTTWSLIFDIQYDENVLDENQIMQSLENAGQFVGIGGFRPEKGGIFGRFKPEKSVAVLSVV
jgi:hypothetical protein